MKAFAATPIILISIVMITGFIFIHFLTMDHWTANVITQESEINKLQISSFKEINSKTANVYSFSVGAAMYSQSETELKNYLKSNFPEVEDIIFNSKNFIIKIKQNYENELGNSEIKTVQEKYEFVDYPFTYLISAANSINSPSGYCSNIKTNIENQMKKYNDIVWSWYPPSFYEISSSCCKTCSYCDENGCWNYCCGWIVYCSYSFTLISNNATGLSKIYPHYINKEFSGNCYSHCTYYPSCLS
ncbi:MAG: hypothetical protein QXO19_03270 [Candidatus Aenigmatarchaeota archaeon]